VNDDTCALTQAEVALTGKSKDETFMGAPGWSYLQNGGE